ncbi:MAG: hypothetical protein OQL19_19330 [Gammaproteobacteria bacterium]|nr:hypothetical protein [Gammaproteobacteria bacterium]
MKECYEYFNCESVDCSKYNNPGENCWDVERDWCHAHSPAVIFLREEVENKKEACKLCFYYKEQTEAQYMLRLLTEKSKK